MKTQKIKLNAGNEIWAQWNEKEKTIDLAVDQKRALSFDVYKLYHGMLFGVGEDTYRIRMLKDTFYIDKNGTPEQKVIKNKDFGLNIINSLSA